MVTSKIIYVRKITFFTMVNLVKEQQEKQRYENYLHARSRQRRLRIRFLPAEAAGSRRRSRQSGNHQGLQKVSPLDSKYDLSSTYNAFMTCMNAFFVFCAGQTIRFALANKRQRMLI